MAINKVILLGNVGTDPEIRTIQSGRKVANLTLATSERAYTTRNGTNVPERTEWHNLVIWGSGAEIVEKYVKKGAKLYVEGKIHTRSWEDDNGVKKYRTEIEVDNFELCDRKRDSNNQPVDNADFVGDLPDYS